MLYYINRSQVEEKWQGNQNVSDFFSLFNVALYQIPLPLNNTYTFIVEFHTSVKKLFVHLCLQISVCQNTFLAEKAVQGKVKHGLFGVFFLCLLNTNFFFISKLLERHNIKLSYKIIDKRTQLLKNLFAICFTNSMTTVSSRAC